MRIIDVIPEYLSHMRAIGRAKRTVSSAQYDLNQFSRFLNEEEVIYPDGLNDEVMREYQRELAFRLTAKGTLLSLRSQAQLLTVAKCFTRYLHQKDYLMSDPGDAITLPKRPKTLPKAILTVEEMRLLILAPDMRSHRGYRNRVVLELLYDTAIRRLELTHIKLMDLDLNAGYIRIEGKGAKDRVVPLSQRVCELTKNYMLMVRPHFIQGEDTGHLILNRWGQKISGASVWAIVKGCAAITGIKKNITTHGLRHTCATHMLKNGAPVRYIQELLGHESLESTQIYTRVTINDLKRIHAQYHPGETMD